jgi:4-amino-4-deoxy-L-arabinose transferase-like glycosyltransferase
MVAAATVLAAVLRGATLTLTSLDNDEGYTIALSEHGFVGMWRLFRFEANGLLYPLVVWPVMQLSHQPVWLRMPAFLAGVAVVPLVFLIGRELGGERLGLWGAFVLAVNPYAVAIAQYARGYAFAILLAAVSWLALLRAQRGSSWWWALYAVATALAGYAQLLALVLIPLGQAVAALVRGRRLAVQWLWALAATVALASPFLALVAAEDSRRNPLYWLSSPGLGVIFQAALADASGRLEWGPDGTFRWVPFAVLALLVWVVVIVSALVRSRHLRRVSDPLFVLLWWATVPGLVLAVVSQARPLFESDRSLVTCVPGVCLLVALAADRLWRRWRVPALAAVVATSVAATLWATTHPAGPDYGAVGRWLNAHRATDEVLVIDPLQRIAPLGIWTASVRAPGGKIDVPEWGLAPLPHDVSGYESRGSYSPAPIGPPPARALASAALRSRGHGVLVVVETTPSGQGDVLASAGIRWLGRRCSTHLVRFPGVVVVDARRCRV